MEAATREIAGPPPSGIDDGLRGPPPPLHGGPIALLRFMRRHRMLTAKRRSVPGEPRRHPRRPQAIVALTVDAVGAFARVEHRVGLIEPPRGESQAFECFGAFLGPQ